MAWGKWALACSFFVLAASIQSCSLVRFSSGRHSGATSCSDCKGESKIIDFTVDALAQGTDIVFVIDNSPSMKSDLNKLVEKFDSFISGLEGRDWQSCVLTTDSIFFKDILISGEGGAKILHPGANSFSNFSSIMANIPVQDEQLHGNLAGVEQGIASINGFLGGTSRYSCLRDKTAKAFIIVSDEDELDDGWISEASPYKPTIANLPESLMRELKSNFADKAEVHLIGILPGDQSCLDTQRNQTGEYNKQSGYFAHRYSQVAQGTFGTQQSICSNDYGGVLKNITDRIRRQVDSIDLGCDGAIVEKMDFIVGSFIPWGVDGSRVVFQNALKPGDRLRVVFRCAR